MKPIINIEAFRQYYEEAVNCKTVLNANAENLSLDDERRLDALLPIYDEHGCDMVKRLIVNAIRQDSQNYSEQVRKWADNAVVAMFIYETDNVLSDYIPDHLSEAAIEAVAKDLIEREKQKNTVKSREGTEYEVIKSEESNCLLCKHTDGIPTYCRAYITQQNAKDADFSDEWMIAEGLSYNKVSSNGSLNVWNSFCNDSPSPRKAPKVNGNQNVKERILNIKNNAKDSSFTNKVFVNIIDGIDKTALLDALVPNANIIDTMQLTGSFVIEFETVQEAMNSIELLNENENVIYAEPVYNTRLLSN